MFVTPEATAPPAWRTLSSASLRCIVASLPVNRNEAPPRSTFAGSAVAAEAGRGRVLGGEVGGHEALDHRLDGEVVVPRLAPGRQPQQPLEAELGGREPADVAEPAEHPVGQGLVELQLPGPCGALAPERRQPGVGLPVGVEGQRLEELEPEGLAA